MDREAEHAARGRRIIPRGGILAIEFGTGYVEPLARIGEDRRQADRRQRLRAMIERADLHTAWIETVDASCFPIGDEEMS